MHSSGRNQIVWPHPFAAFNVWLGMGSVLFSVGCLWLGLGTPPDIPKSAGPGIVMQSGVFAAVAAFFFVAAAMIRRGHRLRWVVQFMPFMIVAGDFIYGNYLALH